MTDAPQPSSPARRKTPSGAYGCGGTLAGAFAGMLSFIAAGALFLFILDAVGLVRWGGPPVPELQAAPLSDLRDAPVWKTDHRWVYRLQRRPGSEDDEAAQLDYRIAFEVVGVQKNENNEETLDVRLRRTGGVYPAETRTWHVGERCLRDASTGERWFCRGGQPRRVPIGDAEGRAFGWSHESFRSAFRPDLGLVELERPADHRRTYHYRLAGWELGELEGGVDPDAVFTCDWDDETAEARDVDELPSSREHRYEAAAAAADIGADADALSLPLSGRHGADQLTLLSNSEGTVALLEDGDTIVGRHRLAAPAYALKVWHGRDDGPDVAHFLLARGPDLSMGLIRIGASTPDGLTWTFTRDVSAGNYFGAHMLADLEGCYFQFRHRAPDVGRPVADFVLTPAGFHKRRGSLEPKSIETFQLTPPDK